jgi:hypothetical protein
MGRGAFETPDLRVKFCVSGGGQSLLQKTGFLLFKLNR